jgi:hypothetical protein
MKSNLLMQLAHLWAIERCAPWRTSSWQLETGSMLSKLLWQQETALPVTESDSYAANLTALQNTALILSQVSPTRCRTSIDYAVLSALVFCAYLPRQLVISIPNMGGGNLHKKVTG